MKSKKVKEKTNIYKWDLKILYKDENDIQIERDIKSATKKANSFISKWSKDQSYLKSPKSLASALNEYEAISEGSGILAKPLYYFGLRIALDQEDKKLKASEHLISDRETDLVNKIQFFELNIGKISKDIQKEMLKYKDLKKYKHYLERNFATSKYDLSDKEEKIVNLLTKSGTSNWTEMISEFISKETGFINKKEFTFDQILSKTSSNKKEERDNANEEINRILDKWVSVAEHEINSFLEVIKNIRKIRNFKDVDSERHISDDLDTKTVKTLIKTVTENFSLSQRFYSFFAKLNKMKTLGYHEKVFEYGEISKKYTIDEGYDLVKDVFRNLSPEFEPIILEAINNGHLDIFPKKGKMGGGFCTFGVDKLPIYILTNYDNTYNDVMTIAHELGHYINHYLSNITVNKLVVIGSVATAEVSSTFFESFVLDKILETATKEEQFNILIQKLQSDVSAIFRQVAFYNFEYELHKNIAIKGYLSKEEIGELFKKHMSSYLGPKVRMEKGHENWWVYWSHLRIPFYVFSYASGQLISKSLRNMVKSDPDSIEKMKVFLSKGGSQSPKDIFKEIGIDISDKKFWEKGLAEFEANLIKAEKLAKELGKI